MNGETTRQRTFRLLADALEYPQPGLVEAVRECATLLAADNHAAAACLHEFGAFVEQTPRGRLEELYTGMFDLDAACYPYVGYHLFGESYKRSVFMLELSERYRAHGFANGSELPDHLAVLLRFLAVCDDATLSGEIVHEALLPALERMDPRRGGVTPPLPGGVTPSLPGGVTAPLPGGVTPSLPGGVTPSLPGGVTPPLPGAVPAPLRDGEQNGSPDHPYRLVLHVLRLVLQKFPANTLQQETA